MLTWVYGGSPQSLCRWRCENAKLIGPMVGSDQLFVSVSRCAMFKTGDVTPVILLGTCPASRPQLAASDRWWSKKAQMWRQQGGEMRLWLVWASSVARAQEHAAAPPYMALGLRRFASPNETRSAHNQVRLTWLPMP